MNKPVKDLSCESQDMEEFDGSHKSHHEDKTIHSSSPG